MPDPNADVSAESTTAGSARETRYFELSADLDEHLRRAADAPVADPTPAATVILVRDAAHRAEVFMLRRRSSMAFAPNRLVFPGGGVDERDSDGDLPWAGPPPATWATWLMAADEAVARELVVAAARELFEECGVLLAGADADSVVADVVGPQWDAEREALLAREQSFAEMLIRRELVLRTDLLRPWAHWVTPEFEPRRYDTRFFAAQVPAGQHPDDRTSEADVAEWVDPVDLLARHAAGGASMLPPTIVCVEHVAAARGASELLDSAPPMGRVMPVVEAGPDGRSRLRCDLPVAVATPHPHSNPP